MPTLEDIAIVYGSSATVVTNPEPGLERRVLATNEKLMLVEHRMQKGWIGAAHSHPNEQIVYVVSGRLRVNAAGQTFDIGKGDSFVVRGGIEHQVSALEESQVLDVFTPSRKDY